MVKVMALLKMNPKLSKEELREYYETVHAKRPIKHGVTHLVDRYTRSYYESSIAGTPPDFDVIMQLWFKDQAHFDTFWATMDDPDFRKLIDEDEAHMFDLTKYQLFLVSEVTGWGWL